MIFLAPYIDESGIHGDAPVTCVAGYVSTTEKWGAFTSEWGPILEDLKRWQSSPEDYFHMTKFAGNFDPYRKFKDYPNEKAAFADRILAAIKRGREFGFCSAVRSQDYGALVSTPILKQMCGSAYSFCVQTCLGWVANWISEVETQTRDKVAPILYTFEKGAPHQAEADRFLKAIAESPKDREGYRYRDHIFLDKRGTPPLPAADVFACEVYRDMVVQLTGERRKGNYYLENLVELGRDRYVVFNRDRLRNTLVSNILSHFRQMADAAMELIAASEDSSSQIS